MKKLSIIFASVLVALAIVINFTFGNQYKAATSLHLITEGMYEYTFVGDYGLDDLMEEGGAASSDDLVRFVTKNHYLASSRKQGSSLYFEDSHHRLNMLQTWCDSLPTMTMEQVSQGIASVASKELTRWTVVFDRKTMSATYYQNADFSHPYVSYIKK